MPGTIGFMTRMPHAQARAEVKALQHENFYVTGMWADESLGVYVGWMARKVCFCDGMPLRNERKDVLLVFSGEEFPEPGTAQRLKERGYEPDATGPGYLVHPYEEDPLFPVGLNGRFRGLLTDESLGEQRSSTIARICTALTITRQSASCILPLKLNRFLSSAPNSGRRTRGVGGFLTCGCVLESRTLFASIYLLALASA